MKARLAWRLASVSYLSLVLLLSVWYGWLSPPRESSQLVLRLLLLTPLLLPLPGILTAKPKAHLIAIFLVLLCFIHGIGEVAVNPAARWLASMEVVLSVAFVVSSSFFIRWHPNTSD